MLPINFLSMPSKYVHFLAAICTNQNTPSISQPVEHEGTSLEWLSSTAKCVVDKYIVPKESKDPVYVYVVPKESKDSIYVLCHSSLCGILVYRPEKANPI